MVVAGEQGPGGGGQPGAVAEAGQPGVVGPRCDLDIGLAGDGRGRQGIQPSGEHVHVRIGRPAPFAQFGVEQAPGLDRDLDAQRQALLGVPVAGRGQSVLERPVGGAQGQHRIGPAGEPTGGPQPPAADGPGVLRAPALGRGRLQGQLVGRRGLSQPGDGHLGQRHRHQAAPAVDEGQLGVQGDQVADDVAVDRPAVGSVFEHAAHRDPSTHPATLQHDRHTRGPVAAPDPTCPLARSNRRTAVTYVIAEPCVDVLDKSCIEECPVDCIYEGGRMLYIHPDECVDCGACEPVCPVEAIFYEDDLPDKWRDYTQANVDFFDELGSPGGASKVGKTDNDPDFIKALPPQGDGA